MPVSVTSASENRTDTNFAMDRETEATLAAPSNWSAPTRDIQSDSDQQALDQQQRSNGLIKVASARVFGQAKSGATKNPVPAPIYNLLNHNGPTLGDVHLYAIWWGPTANFPAGYRASIDAALSGMQCTTVTCAGMSSMMNQYLGTNSKTAITFSGDLVDTSAPVSSAPSTAAIVTEANKVATNAAIDPKGLYLVFTSNFPSRANYCGWHGAGAVNNKWFTVAYMPNLSGVAGCSATYLPSYSATANRLAAVDSVVNVLTHEVYETITDPMLNNQYAWYDALGNEIGDKCAWSTSSQVNLGSAGRFTVQKEWSNAASACAAA